MPSKASNLAGFASSISSNNNLNVGIVTASGFVGNVTGNLTGNVTGNLTGTASTATAAAAAYGLIGTPNVVLGIATVSAGSTSAPSITPTGDSNTGVFFPSADTIAFAEGGVEALRINSSSNIGVGTTNPSSKLEVYGGNTTSVTLKADTEPGIDLNTTDGNKNVRIFNSYGNFGISGYSGGENYILYHNNGSGVPANQYTYFQVGGSERLRITGSGRLLVGTSSARSNYLNNSIYSGLLQVEGTTDASRIISFVHNTADGAQPFIVLGKTRGSAAGSNTVVQDADGLGTISFQGSDGTELVEGARIQCNVDGTPGANDMPGRLIFSTTADGASSPTERMRLDSSGRLSMYGAYQTSGIGNQNKFQVSENGRLFAVGQGGTFNTHFIGRTGGDGTLITFTRDTSEVGTISVTSTATAYNTSSDYRLKENVTLLTGATDRLKQLPVHRFNFIADPAKTVDGFIAHEVQTVVPEAISGEKDAVDDDGNPIYQGIDQSKLVPLLTAALQEAIGRIETLEAEVADLKAQ